MNAMRLARFIPVYEFGPRLLLHHSFPGLPLMPEKPYMDAREQGVSRSARPAPLSYQATEASIAEAKRVAAEERKRHEQESAAALVRRQEMANQLAAMVDEFGWLAVRYELDRLEVRP